MKYFQDFEVLIAEPLIKWLPNPNKNFVQKYLAPCYFYFLYSIFTLTQLIGRIRLVAKRKHKLRWENLIIFLELGIILISAPTIWVKKIVISLIQKLIKLIAFSQDYLRFY